MYSDGKSFYAAPPECFGNVSGFNLLTDAERAQFDFLPVVDVIPPHDPALERLTETGLTRVGDVYERHFTAAAISLAERVEAAHTQRRFAYPPFTDYLDAQVKKASVDPVVQAAGAAQETAYIQACEAVKTRFPIPTV